MCLQVTVKNIASGALGDMTPSCGVLSCIASHSEAARELIFAARPAVLPHLLNALSLGSPSLTAAAVGMLPASFTCTSGKMAVLASNSCLLEIVSSCSASC